MLGGELRQAACPAATELAVPVGPVERPGQGYLAPCILDLGWAARVGSTEELPGGRYSRVCPPPASPSGLSHAAARKAWKRGIPGAEGGRGEGTGPSARPVALRGRGGVCAPPRGPGRSGRWQRAGPAAPSPAGRYLPAAAVVNRAEGALLVAVRRPPPVLALPFFPAARGPGAAGPAVAGAGPSVTAAPR